MFVFLVIVESSIDSCESYEGRNNGRSVAKMWWWWQVLEHNNTWGWKLDVLPWWLEGICVGESYSNDSSFILQLRWSEDIYCAHFRQERIREMIDIRVQVKRRLSLIYWWLIKDCFLSKLCESGSNRFRTFFFFVLFTF